MNDEPVFNEEISHSLIDLIKGLLWKNPQKRMKFVRKIKDHHFFSGMDFQKVYSKQYRAHYTPEYARGTKMIKVIKDEVSSFTDFESFEFPKATYFDGFDYNCS